MTEIIITQISIALRVSREEMTSAGKRTRALADARFISYTALKASTDLTLAEIAAIFHKDPKSGHATVLHGISEYKSLNKTDKAFQAKVARCRRRITW